MNENNIVPKQINFFNRLFANPAARQGVAGAIAGVLVAVVSEVIWPSDR